MRLSGLASGFDTDTMVQNLMQVERMKVNRFAQRKQINLWQQQQYTKINKNLANFVLDSKRNMGLNKVSNTGSIKNSSYKNLDYINKAVSSNEDALGVTVTGKSSQGSFNVDVKSIAKSASHTTGEITNEDLKDLKELNLKINNEVIEITGKDGKDITIKDIIDGIENIEDGKGNKKDTGLTAFYDKGTKRIFIQGQANDKNIENASGKDGYEFDLNVSIEGNDKIEKAFIDEAKIISGRVGAAEINGIEMFTKDNNIEFNGLRLELKEVTGDSPVIIDVNTNTDGIVEKITGLVDEYNKMLDMLAEQTTQKRYPSYHPLSQEEKNEMHERDVELWEEKAKSGMLHNDETINRMTQRIREDIYKNVEGLEGKFKNITELGITTEGWSKGAVAGRLQIDEDKLRSAIEEDADGVMELLFSEKTDADLDFEGGSSVSRTNKGVFTGIYDNVISGMKSIVEKSGPGEDSDLLRNVKSNLMIDFVTKQGSISDLDKTMSTLDRKIADMEVLLAKKEETYYARFTAMEKQMYKMNSQGDWLMQQMSM